MYRQIEDQFAYMAGFIEGDGSLVLCEGTKGTKGTKRTLTVLSVYQKERRILDYFQKLTGVGSVHKKITQNPIWGTGVIHSWIVSSGPQLRSLLPKIIPYLFSSKKRKARLLLRFCQAMRIKNTRKRLPAGLRKRRRHLMREWMRVLPEIKPIVNPPLSLLAGFVDADGCIGKVTNRITVTQKDRALLDYLRKEAGGIGNICQRATGIYDWRFTNSPFMGVLNPYLKIKRKKI